jgi:hypothetical protein
MEFPAGHRSDLVNKSIDGALVLLVRRQRWHRQHVAVAGPSESFMGAAAGGRRRRWLAAASPGHGLPSGEQGDVQQCEEDEQGQKQ